MQTPLSDALTQPNFIWRGISWHNRQPWLTIEPLTDQGPSGQTQRLPLASGDYLGFEVIPADQPQAGTYCAGYSAARAEGIGFETRPCPDSRLISKGKQCETCLARDEFAPIHRVHLGARMTEAALAYANLPHYLYVATFPDGSSKVGTASLHSNPRRLDDQAVAAATFVAKAQTGLLVRQLEDLVSQEANLTQFKHGSTKYKGWLAPAPAGQIASEHYMAVENATWALEDAQDELEGFEILEDRWQAPELMGRAHQALVEGVRQPLAAYPDLLEGPQGFLFEGATGKFLTVQAAAGQEPVFLVNTLPLTNRACRLAEGLSLPDAVEAPLF